MYKRFRTNLVSTKNNQPILFEEIRDGLGDLLGLGVYETWGNGYSRLEGTDIYPNYLAAKQHLIGAKMALEREG